MKHLRILNLLVVLLLMAAWVPLPQSFSSTTPAVAAAIGSVGSLKPASGTTAAVKRAQWPTFQWTFTPSATATGPYTFKIEFATDTKFTKNVVIAEGPNLVVDASKAPVYTATTSIPFVNNTKVYWRVYATNVTDTSKSGYMYLTTLPKPVGSYDLPSSVTPTDTLRPELRWDMGNPAPAGAVTSYSVQIALNSGFSSAVSYSTKENRLEIPVNLKVGKTYFWRVKSVGTYGTVTPALPPATFTTPATMPPAVPTLVSPANPTSLKVTSPFAATLKWKCPTCLAGTTYNLQISTSKLFSDHPAPIPQTDFEEPVTFDTPGVYYWRVQAVSADGTLKSGWTAPWAIKTASVIKVTLKDTITQQAVANGTTVFVTTSSTCKNTGTYAQYVQATGTTLDGAVTLSPVTAGTRYICTVDLHDQDYKEVKLSKVIAAGQTYTYDIGVVKPVMTVTVYWYTPSDLNIHLWAPEELNTDAYVNPGHIYANNPNYKGNLTASPWAKVTADKYGATTTLKKETITIQNRVPGTYLIAVYNSTREDWPTPKGKPYIKVTYNGVVQKFDGLNNMPLPDGTGRWWVALSIDGATGVVTPIKQLQVLYPGPYDPNATGDAILK